MQSDLFSEMAQSIINGQEDQAADLAKKAIAAGIPPLDAIDKGFVKGVDEIGERFSCGDAFLPELVMAGKAMKTAVKILEPELKRQGGDRKALGKVVLGTIEGDIHDIGKTLVGTMLSASGFEVIDLGVNVPVIKLVETARELGADLIGVSALLSTTMRRQKDVVEAVADLGLAGKIKVIVGGAPVSEKWARDIGADGYSQDAVGAVALAKTLVGSK